MFHCFCILDPLTSEMHTEELEKPSKCLNKKVYAVVFIIGLVITLVLLWLFCVKQNSSECSEPLLIIPREEWYARPPQKSLQNLELPSIRVIITDTETDNCSKQVFSLCPFERKIYFGYNQFVHIFSVLIVGDVCTNSARHSKTRHGLDRLCRYCLQLLNWWRWSRLCWTRLGY